MDSTIDQAESMLSLRQRYVPSAYLQLHPIVAASAEGAWLIDVEGRQYLDFAGGIGVMNIGQRHPRVVEAVKAQADRLMHSGPVMIHENYAMLAARLAETVAPGREWQALLLNSGAEAVENAVKIARHATGRPAVIAFEGSFHGRTLLTSTLNGKTAPYKTQPGSMAPEIHHAPFPNPYRPPKGVSSGDLSEHCLESLERVVDVRVPSDQVAAVIVEPVQGEGGYVVPPVGFLQGVQRFCRRIGALLIVDEIQTGFGRTGKMFSFEWDGLEPDIVTIGKSMAAGMPLTAVLTSKTVFDRVYSGDLGGTYGGNPVACAAAMAVLDVFAEEPVLEAAQAVGSFVRGELEDMASQFEAIGDVRGLGAMLAVELVRDRASKEPASSLTTEIMKRARENGVIVIKAGPYGSAIRLLVPLLIGRDDLETGMRRLREAFAEACD